MSPNPPTPEAWLVVPELGGAPHGGFFLGNDETLVGLASIIILCDDVSKGRTDEREGEVCAE